MKIFLKSFQIKKLDIIEIIIIVLLLIWSKF